MDKPRFLREFKAAFAEASDDDLTAFSRLCDLARKDGAVVFSHFHSPVFVACAMGILSGSGDLSAFGGYDGAERQIIGFSADIEDFPIARLKISFNEKFAEKLSHRDFLGSALGLGLDRRNIGDIVLLDGFAVIYVHESIKDYIAANLSRVRHTPVKISEISAGPPGTAPAGRIQTKTITSLRTDALISACFGLSREKAKALLDSGRVFVNWRPAANAAKNIEPGSVITVRSLGRAVLREILGKSKKDKFIIEVEIFS
ncbi:MAG: RNA-binding protein [Clostridiales bacterium]|jgi:RNA-binding protein YlmH|nr:RNA-binding protein [Clostridiales bacterium]